VNAHAPTARYAQIIVLSPNQTVNKTADADTGKKYYKILQNYFQHIYHFVRQYITKKRLKQANKNPQPWAEDFFKPWLKIRWMSRPGCRFA
jgi:hypothetical protein